jgi:hypothetical protein
VPVALAAAVYDTSNDSVTLVPRRRLAAGTAIQLQVHAAAILDAGGRPLAGNNDGQPAGDFTALVKRTKGGS